jgi:hypothetical protein
MALIDIHVLDNTSNIFVLVSLFIKIERFAIALNFYNTRLIAATRLVASQIHRALL